MKILVTGGTGFTGKALVKRLIGNISLMIFEQNLYFLLTVQLPKLTIL